MLHLSKIAADDDCEHTLTGIRENLSVLASGLDARFVEAGSALASAYDIVERLIGALEGVTGALDREATDAAVENMRATASRLARLPALQDDRRHDLSAMHEASRMLSGHITQINRTLSFLRICGLNIKVAAAGADEFSGFADNMFVRLELGEDQLSRFEREANGLAARIAQMVDAEALLAAECAKVIPQVPAKLAEDAAALQRHQAEIATCAAQIADIARDIRGKVATALSAIQIGDITRQRLEHVVEGIRILSAFLNESVDVDNASAEALEGRTLALLAAQAGDAISAFQRDAGILTRSLRSISPEANRLVALKEKSGAVHDSEGQSFLGVLEQGIAEVASVTAQLHRADEHTDRLGSATSQTAESLAQRLKMVRKVQSDVEQMAWNTGLRCRRMGEDGLALAVIATEIRQFSSNLKAVSDRIGHTFEQLVAAAASIRAHREKAGRIDAACTLAESLESVRAGGERVRNSLASLDGDAAQVAAILHDSTDKVDCQAEIGPALAATVADLAALAQPKGDLSGTAATVLRAVFTRIAQTYTMAREREIHKQFAVDNDIDVPAENGGTAGDVGDDDLFEDALF